MAFKNRGGWNFVGPMWQALLINSVLQAVLMVVHWGDERAWFEIFSERPASTIAYLLGRIIFLPLAVFVVIGIQNLFALAFPKRISN